MVNKSPLEPMAQGYMTIEYVPSEVGAEWEITDSEDNSSVTLEGEIIPFWYLEPHVDPPADLKPLMWHDKDNIDEVFEDEGHAYWIEWSLSGITDPYLMRIVDIPEPEPPETAKREYMIGVWGTNSYRTIISTYHDDESDESEIP